MKSKTQLNRFLVIMSVLVIMSPGIPQKVTEVPVKTNDGNDQIETSIAVDPSDKSRFIIGYSDRTPGDYDNYSSHPGYGISTDNGGTWATGVVFDSYYWLWR